MTLSPLCELFWLVLLAIISFSHATCRCPGYSVPDRSNFISLRLAAEVEAVAGKLLVYFANFIHLTLSFDGWSSKGHNKIYTGHVTTPGRRSFLVEGWCLPVWRELIYTLVYGQSCYSSFLVLLTKPSTNADYCSIYGNKFFSCGFRHHCQCEEVPPFDLREVAMGP